MNRTRWRLLVACLAVIGAAIAAAGGSAGNREGTGTLVPQPGPGAVTYGENIAYKATFTNDSGAVFTQSKYVMPPPVTSAGEKATPVSASCGAFDAGNVLNCQFGQIRPGGKVELTVVWKTPSGATKPGCTDCLDAGGTFLIKEGKQTNFNESFPVGALASLIGVSSNDPVNSNQRAGGFELKGCDSTTPTSLVTNQAIDATTNPVTTALCFPASFLANGAAGGVATTITEPSSSSPNYLRQSEVCVAKPGTNCGDGTYLPQDFGPAVITVTIQVSDLALKADPSLPKGYKIEKIFHNGEELTAATCARAVNPECVISIKLDNQKKVWTIVATSEINGPWNW